MRTAATRKKTSAKLGMLGDPDPRAPRAQRALSALCPPAACTARAAPGPRPACAYLTVRPCRAQLAASEKSQRIHAHQGIGVCNKDAQTCRKATTSSGIDHALSAKPLVCRIRGWRTESSQAIPTGLFLRSTGIRTGRLLRVHDALLLGPVAGRPHSARSVKELTKTFCKTEEEMLNQTFCGAEKNLSGLSSLQ